MFWETKSYCSLITSFLLFAGGTSSTWLVLHVQSQCSACTRHLAILQGDHQRGCSRISTQEVACWDKLINAITFLLIEVSQKEGRGKKKRRSQNASLSFQWNKVESCFCLHLYLWTHSFKSNDFLSLASPCSLYFIFVTFILFCYF